MAGVKLKLGRDAKRDLSVGADLLEAVVAAAISPLYAKLAKRSEVRKLEPTIPNNLLRHKGDPAHVPNACG